MPPPSVRISEGDPSDAFYHQFSTIIRLESRLQGDRSEDAIGPAHQRWVVRHLDEVARAQGFTSQLSTQTATLNVHAQEFITPSHAQPTISSRLGHITPWYENFNLADQGVYNISGPYYPTASTTAYYHLPYPPSPYNRLNPADLTVFREAVRAQPFQSSNQYTESQHSVPTEYLNYNPDPFRHPNSNHPRSHLPSTPPNNSPRVGYPSTPPNQPPRHPRQTSPTDSSPDLVATTMLRASTEPIAQSARMGFLTAPDHYIPLEVYALDVHIGDYIQSVKNPGQVMNHYPCAYLDHQPISEYEAGPVSPDGGIRIIFKGADGTIRTKVFKGLDKVQVLREVAKQNNDDGDKGKEVKKES